MWSTDQTFSLLPMVCVSFGCRLTSLLLKFGLFLSVVRRWENGVSLSRPVFSGPCLAAAFVCFCASFCCSAWTSCRKTCTCDELGLELDVTWIVFKVGFVPSLWSASAVVPSRSHRVVMVSRSFPSSAESSASGIVQNEIIRYRHHGLYIKLEDLFSHHI